MLIENFYQRMKSAVDKGLPFRPNRTNAERETQRQRLQKSRRYRQKPQIQWIEKLSWRIPDRTPKRYSGKLSTPMLSQKKLSVVSWELPPIALTAHQSKLNALEQQIKEVYSLLQKQQNRLNLSNWKSTEVINRWRQNNQVLSLLQKQRTLPSFVIKRMMMKHESNHKVDMNVEHFAFVTAARGKNLASGLKVSRTMINPDTGIRMVRNSQQIVSNPNRNWKS